MVKSFQVIRSVTKKIRYNKMVALKEIGSKDPSDQVVGKGILKR